MILMCPCIIDFIGGNGLQGWGGGPGHSWALKWHVRSCARDNLRGQKSLGPLKMSLEMAHKVIVPPKKKLYPKVS